MGVMDNSGDGCGKLLSNVDQYVKDYTTLQPRRPLSSSDVLISYYCFFVGFVNLEHERVPVSIIKCATELIVLR